MPGLICWRCATCSFQTGFLCQFRNRTDDPQEQAASPAFSPTDLTMIRFYQPDVFLKTQKSLSLGFAQVRQTWKCKAAAGEARGCQ